MLSTYQTKTGSLLFGLTMVLFTLGFTFFHAKQSIIQASPSILGVFRGTTPCSTENPSISLISTDTPCEMMIWHITLNYDPDINKSTTYVLDSAYGMSKPNTPDIAGGGTKLVLDGTWQIIRGTKSDPDAVVYQLNSADPKVTIYFVKMDDNLIHLLTEDKSLKVGNGGWSYTLSNADPKPVSDAALPTAEFTDNNSTLSSTATTTDLVGVFEGRTPCSLLVADFFQIIRDSGCNKVKWRLTLYQNMKTGEPTTYKLKGTRTSREGTWTITHGTKANPQATVYQFSVDNGEPPVSFLKADDNHLFMLDANLNLLVGDEYLSYTLSRKE